MEKSEIKGFIAKRVAKELKDGDVVNLGIGLPTLGPNYLPEGIHVTLQAENGTIGSAAASKENPDPIHDVDAGGSPSGVAEGGCFIDSTVSFGLIRGGHVDATILGGLEVDEEGSLSNWIIPGKMVPGMGGAMDLLVGAKEVIVAMELTTRDGGKKIVSECSFPLTAARCVDHIVTEQCVIDVTDEGLVLKEIRQGKTPEDIQALVEPRLTVAGDLKTMEE